MPAVSAPRQTAEAVVTRARGVAGQPARRNAGQRGGGKAKGCRGKALRADIVVAQRAHIIARHRRLGQPFHQRRLRHGQSFRQAKHRARVAGELADIAHQHSLPLMIDNTFASPYLQNPLDLGADMVMHSATKYLGGHSDVIQGCLVVNDKQLRDDLYFIQKSCGAVPGPQDCFLILRGIKTLHIRVQRACENAEKIAILGLNSNWTDSVIMSRKKDGTFTADVNLPKDSSHEFKYLVNETEWVNDPEADSQSPNIYGGTNSVVVI